MVMMTTWIYSEDSQASSKTLAEENESDEIVISEGITRTKDADKKDV
jgi:hypothetical protein